MDECYMYMEHIYVNLVWFIVSNLMVFNKNQVYTDLTL